MSVKYRGKVPELTGVNTRILYDYGIICSYYGRHPLKDFRHNQYARFIFRKHGLIGEIRTCQDTWAVDVTLAWGENRCITTECKTIREAKDILFQWFRDNEWRRKLAGWRDRYYDISVRYEIRYND